MYSCITPLSKAGLVVIPVAQLSITLPAGTVVVQILIQGRTQLINIPQRNGVNGTVFLLIVRQKNCREIK